MNTQTLKFEELLPSEYEDRWDEEHVKLPCSPQNTYRRRSQPEKKLSKWYLIGTVLSPPMTTAEQLEVPFPFMFAVF